MKITLCTNIKYIERIYKLISSLESLLQVKMSRHDGVSCDSCLKNNFRGRRYKCLICYDYDLCASCYEEGATTTRHTAEHPMQCILTRSDFELYYGGEALNLEQPQAYTCPYCNRMGYTDNSLQEHVTSDHTDTSFEVVCPVCAALPGGDPNLVTEDFAGHLTLEHRTGPRDLISFLDEPSGIRHGGVRRVQHASRGVGSTRARRSNMHFSSSGGLSSLSPSSRDAVDPIAELLSQLSGVRRSAAAGTTGGNSGTTPSQLQQLHMQIQLERQQVSYLQAARQQLERLPRRQTQAGSAASQSAATAPREPQTQGTGGNSVANALLASSQALPNTGAAPCTANNSQFLLTRFMATSMSDTELAAVEQQRADRSLFAQSLALATLTLHEQEPEEEPEVLAPIANSNDSNESLNNSSPPVDKPNDVKKIGPPRDNQSPGNTKPKGSKPPPPADRKSKLNSNNKPRDLKSRGDTPKTRPEANQLSERR